jgi:hypothetical protein
MEMEQSVARIEVVGRDEAQPGDSAEPEASEPDTAESDVADSEPDPGSGEAVPVESLADESTAGDLSAGETPVEDEEPRPVGEITDDAATAALDVAGEPLEVTPSPWNAYGGVTEGLAESAMPGAEQSWGEAEANIAAIAEEAAAQVYGRTPPPEMLPPTDPVAVSQPEAVFAPDAAEPVKAPESPSPAEPPTVEPHAEASEVPDPNVEPMETEPAFLDEVHVESPDPGPAAEPPIVEPFETIDTPEPAPEAPAPEPSQEPTAVVASLSEIEAVLDQEPTPEEPAAPTEFETASDVAAPESPIEQQEVMMDFGTLEMVDPESVWAEGAEDFAPWFLAHSRQLGDVLGLETGLSDAHQFDTKSATGVVGRDDDGEDVVVVSSQNAVADDSDLGRALGMAASSGAATVALVSAKFNDEQLQALAWLNNQTKSGVQWYGIEMRVVRIADSPAAMMFDLVASPPED